MSNHIIFDHIPKTAGISILSALKLIFPDFKNINHYESEVYHKNALEKYENSSFGGHLQFQHFNTLSKDHYYCTILRDPVERFISQYFFNIQEGNKSIQNKDLNSKILLDLQVIASLKYPINEYINHGILKTTYSNVQALHFAARMCADPLELNEKQLIDAAISSLEGYSLIGSFNHLDDFIRIIAQDFNKFYPQIEKYNTTSFNPNRNEVESTTLQKIHDHNLADYALIQWAKQRHNWNNKKTTSIKITKDNSKNIIIVDQDETTNLTIEHKITYNEKSIRFSKLEIFPQQGSNTIIISGEEIQLNIELTSEIDDDETTVGIAIRDKENNLVYGINNFIRNEKIECRSNKKTKLNISFVPSVPQGFYSITIALHKGRDHTQCCYEWIDNAFIFGVLGQSDKNFEGTVDCNAVFTIDEINV